MSVLAAIRPDEVNLPLLLHVFGAMLLVGTLFTVAIAIVGGWRRSDDADATALTRFGLWTLLVGVVPSWILMRIGAQWTESELNFPDDFDPAWLGIGYITAEAGGILILISLVLSIVGLRRLRGGSGAGLGKAVGIIAILLVVAYLVAVWAMTAKPD